jgi:butyrate kinase
MFWKSRTFVRLLIISTYNILEGYDVHRILVINPGSTSTKIALFENEQELFAQNLFHSAEELAPFPTIIAQLPLRLNAIERFLEKNNIIPETIDAFVGRGGLLYPIPSGTYYVNERMVADLERGVLGEHASNLGGLLAKKLAKGNNKPAFIVDPVVVDEMDTPARLSGHPLLPRKSIFHALNHKAIGRKAATQLGKKYQDLNLVIAHLGGGISVAAHAQGRVVDVNNALDGEGPFSPERTGTLPAGDLARVCFSEKYTLKEIQKMIVGKGGIVAYLGSNDMRLIVQHIADGDEKARTVYYAMAYQIAKEIGAMSTVLRGSVDAIILTGGIAFDDTMTAWIRERVSFIAPVLIIPGEEEMEALALGALRILCQEEQARQYNPVQQE